MDRLPRGRHGLPPEFVARNQRERLIAGLMQALYELGYQKTTVSLIGQRAAVSKSDFYKHFASKDDCFLAAYDAAVDRIRGRVLTTCAEHRDEDWALRVRDAIRALLDILSEDPALASMTLVEGLRAGPGMYDRYQGAVESFVACLREEAPYAPAGGRVPAATDEAIVGGIASMLGRRVVSGEAEQVTQFFPELVEFALTPYLGAAEARRIASSG